MDSLPLQRQEQQVAVAECRHHWLVESPSGPTSMGICRICGAVKLFENVLPKLVGENDFTLPRPRPRTGRLVFREPHNSE